MAGVSSEAPYVYDISNETYAHSLERYRMLGTTAIAYAHDPALAQEYRIARGLTFAEWESAVIEGASTPDSELRERIDTERFDTYSLDEVGRVVLSDGTLMRTLVQRGIEASTRTAEGCIMNGRIMPPDPRMWLQVERDRHDLAVVDIVDVMPEGSAYVGVSLPPEDGLRQDPDFWKEKGYRPQETKLQLYVKANGKLLTGCYSVGASDERQWRALLQEYGVVIPAELSCNDWVDKGVHFPSATAFEQVESMRQRYYQLANAAQQRYSVSAAVTARRASLEGQFEAYVEPFSQALATGETNNAMQQFACALHDTPGAQQLHPDIYVALQEVAARQPFTPARAQAMELVIRYAAVQSLRLAIEHMIDTPPSLSNYGVAYADMLWPDMLLQQTVSDMSAGLIRGDSYGGCAGLSITNRTQTRSSSEGDPQSNFGGRTSSSESEASDGGICDYWHTGCYCSPFNADGSDRKTPLEVPAHSMPSGKTYCGRGGCNAWIDKNGDSNIGDIARRAAARQRKQPRQLIAA